MHEVERATWSPNLRDLWRRIAAHPFERADDALDFTRRLARDRGWSRDFARGAVAEYRRFCFLACIFDTPVTPSEEVDEVWHQHLTYSRDYWERWCGDVLRTPLHHDPTAGGPAEQARYRAQYAETLARYEAYFGPPDPSYWPGTRQRFRARPRYRIVDADRVWLLPRLRLRFGAWPGCAAGTLGLLPALPRPAAALPSDWPLALPPNPLDWTAEPFLLLYAILGAATCALAALWHGVRTRGAAPDRHRDLGLLELALLAGGRARAGDTIVLGWLTAGAARLDPPERRFFQFRPTRILVDDATAALPPEWQPFRGTACGPRERGELLKTLAAGLGTVETGLAQRGLLAASDLVDRLKGETVLLFAPVVLLGAAKLVVGTSRDKPVGFLLLGMLVLVGICIAFCKRQTPRTRSGDAALDHYRERHARAANAPRTHELLFAFALGGAAVLAGTELAAYGHLMQGTDGDSGGSGGGDGGCGGGCGGCGS